MNFTREQWAAAMAVAVQKIVESGMTKDEAVAYVNNNTEKLYDWCVKLMTEGSK